MEGQPADISIWELKQFTLWFLSKELSKKHVEIAIKFSSCLSVCLSAVCLSVCCLTDCLSAWLSVCLFVLLSACQPACLTSVCLSVCLPVWLSVCLSACLTVCLFVDSDRLSGLFRWPVFSLWIWLLQDASCICWARDIQPAACEHHVRPTRLLRNSSNLVLWTFDSQLENLPSKINN